MKQALKLLAPYLAVGVFWCGFSHGWLAILVYHAQILVWRRDAAFELRRSSRRRLWLLALPAAAAGPLVYFLLPTMTQVPLFSWLAEHHLSGMALLIMVPYFGLVHPFLEQLHWAPLRESTPLAHVLFAGYHMLVLYELLALPWLLLCFVVLAGASVLWQQIATRTGSHAIPVAMHTLADLGIVAAAWWSV